MTEITTIFGKDPDSEMKRHYQDKISTPRNNLSNIRELSKQSITNGLQELAKDGEDIFQAASNQL